MKKVSIEKKLTIFSLIVFVVSIVPILYLAKYVHATGDDFGYGALTHAAWLESHSLIAVLKASCRTIYKYDVRWQGTWFSVFLFSLQPEVFSPDLYWIVPVVMLILIIIGTSLPIYYFLVCRIGMKKYSFIVIDCTILFLMIQFFPSTKSGIFWYNGTAHYIIPYFIAMMSIYNSIRFIDSYRKRYLLGAIVCMTLLGGASYLAALFAPIVLVFFLFCYGRKRPKAFWLFIPLGLEMAGLIISFIAPGNKVRGGEDFGFSVFNIFTTVGESFKAGIKNIQIYAEEKPAIFVILVLLTVFIWHSYTNIEKKIDFKMPIAFCAYMFCCYSAMFAPGIYAGTELSGGVPNTIFQIFVLTTLTEIIYISGWLSTKIAKYDKVVKCNGNMIRLIKGCFLLVVCTFFIFLYRSTLKETTFFKCLFYITSGQASDYGEQMEERQAILLDDTIKDAKLPAMNQDQGPLMHMEVTKDKDSWTNQVVRDFYRKNSVVEIDRVQ